MKIKVVSCFLICAALVQGKNNYSWVDTHATILSSSQPTAKVVTAKNDTLKLDNSSGYLKGTEVVGQSITITGLNNRGKVEPVYLAMDSSSVKSYNKFNSRNDSLCATQQSISFQQYQTSREMRTYKKRAIVLFSTATVSFLTAAGFIYEGHWMQNSSEATGGLFNLTLNKDLGPLYSEAGAFVGALSGVQFGFALSQLYKYQAVRKGITEKAKVSIYVAPGFKTVASGVAVRF